MYYFFCLSYKIEFTREKKLDTGSRNKGFNSIIYFLTMSLCEEWGAGTDLACDVLGIAPLDESPAWLYESKSEHNIISDF